MAKTASQHFDRVAHRYDDAVASYKWDGCDFLVQEISKHHIPSWDDPPLRILDHGSGTGIMSEKLKTTLPRGDVISLDVSRNMLRAHKTKNNYAACIRFDGKSYPFRADTFDITASAGVLEFIKDHKKSLRDLVDVTTEKGIIGITCLSRIQYGSIQGRYAVLREKLLRVPFYCHSTTSLKNVFESLGCQILHQSEQPALTYPNGNRFYYGTIIARKVGDRAAAPSP